jgi:hypothetical protein
VVQRLIPSGVAAAIAGGTMAVALSCCPSFAFTLSAPSLAQSVVKADVQQVYYYGHPYYHHLLSVHTRCGPHTRAVTYT